MHYGVKITGCTVHFVDDHPHLGPVIFQQPIEVREHDTVTSLEARVFAAECDLLPEAINLLATNRPGSRGTQDKNFCRLTPQPRMGNYRHQNEDS